MNQRLDIDEIITRTADIGFCIISGSSLDIFLKEKPKKFFRHGWQSWSLSTWLNTNEPVVPIASRLTRVKDEDIPYSLSNHPVAAWIGAAELDENNIVLVGALDLSGRVELINCMLRGFYEDGHEGQWLVVVGSEIEAFDCYKNHLVQIYGVKEGNPPRVWCSWYSLYNTINESIIDKVIDDLVGFPIDVIQIDDGWQKELGDWEANLKFPSGMKAFSSRVHATGRKAGIWLAPFIVARTSKLIHKHPDWLLRDQVGQPVHVGVGWSGELYALNSSHPEVLEWISKVIERIINWDFDYLKLDFLYAAASPGVYKSGIPRENAYRNAMQVIRQTAGSKTYLLACGAPIIPTLGVCNGIRIGPDVAPFWQNKPLSIWMNNPSNPGTQNGIRTCLHRLWLKDLINIDADVAYFRSRHNQLDSRELSFLHDIVRITGFKATSDLPQWLSDGEREYLQTFFSTTSNVQKLDRYKYQIDDRIVDFSGIIPLPGNTHFPVNFALLIGMLQMVLVELLPGYLESIKARLWKRKH